MFINMTIRNAVRILFIAAMGGVVIGCLNPNADPEWHEMVLTSMSKESGGGLSWARVDTPVSHGIAAWSGKPAPGGCLALDEFEHMDSTNRIELSVARFKDEGSAQCYYSVRRQMKDVPIHREGSVNGFEYAITKSVRPQNGPAGGGFQPDGRITCLDIWKNVTVVEVIVHSRGADGPVNVDDVVKAVNQAVGRG